VKSEIHPSYHTTRVHCTCGSEFLTRSSSKNDEIRVEVCSECHPFYTGRQKLMDTGGRVERFQRKLAKSRQAQRQAASSEG
jgi:large subunit ribosomal protein L31